MSTLTSADQEAMRVANRYAASIEKATTLQDRARACQDAAQQYRRDAQANQESVETHREAARAIHDPRLADQHALAARDAEAEAAREILAARYYEAQAEHYQAQARAIAPTGPAGVRSTAPVLDQRREVAGHYDGARGCTTGTGKDAMATGTAGPAATEGAGLPDAAGLTETAAHWHGSDVLTASSGDGTVALGRWQYPDSDAYVVVATIPAGKRWTPDSDDGIDPALSATEADVFADAIDELVAHAQSGAPLRAPTKMEKLAGRIRGLLGDSGVTIIGDEGEIEVSAADIRKLLTAAAPEPAVPARRKINAQDCLADDMDTGAVWVELDTSSGEPMVAIASTEGEPPESYPAGYTITRLSLAEAADLAAQVRRFAGTTSPAGDATEPGSRPQPAVAAPAQAPQQRRVTNPRGRVYEYDPADGSTAVIESDGWRAVVPPSSSTGATARLLWWNAEIKDGRGDDATEETARALLGPLTAAELREVADEVGMSSHRGRTKAELVDAIVALTISSARKSRG